MRNIFLFCIPAFFLFSCSEKKEKNIKNDVSFYKLNGEVKSYDELSYDVYDSSGHAVKGYLWFARHLIFDKKGNYTELKTQRKNDSIVHFTFKKYDSDERLVLDSSNEFTGNWNIYLYNANGNRIERDEYYLNNGQRKRGITEIYIVDKNGIKIEEDSYWGNRDSLNYKAYIENNERGQETEKDIFNDKGMLHIKVFRKYDEKGNETEFFITNKHDSVENKSTYSYDSAGNKIEDCSYNKDGSLFSKSIIKYDARGNATEEKTTNPDSSMSPKISYGYEAFDKQGNWLKKITYTDGKPTDIMERTITYY